MTNRILTSLARLFPTTDPDREKSPNLWQWIKLFLDSDEQTREAGRVGGG